jgi:serine protease Do
MAIGSPFGLDNSVTAGIVSAKQRETGEYLPFIQTDVAINPGNSGGPLLNMRGEVVGINSQIYSRSGGFMGISFAIPMDEAMRVSDQLKKQGKVTRGYLGIRIDHVGKEVADSLGWADAKGAMVLSVEAQSAAAKAGVEAGDIVVRLDGKAIDKAIDLPRMVGGIKPGTRVVLTVYRRGKTKDLPLQVGELEADQKVATSSPSPKNNGTVDKTLAATKAWGLSVSDLSDAQKAKLQVRRGVRVDAVEGVAAKAGLREGDVILDMANVEIQSTHELNQVLAKLDKTQPQNLLFLRDGLVKYLVVKSAAPEKTPNKCSLPPC